MLLHKRTASEMASAPNVQLASGDGSATNVHRQWLRALRHEYNERVSRASIASEEELDLERDDHYCLSDDGGDMSRRQSYADLRRSSWSEAHTLAEDFVHALGMDSTNTSGEWDDDECAEEPSGGRVVVQRTSAVETVEQEWLNDQPPMLRRQSAGALWRLAARRFTRNTSSASTESFVMPDESQ